MNPEQYGTSARLVLAYRKLDIKSDGFTFLNAPHLNLAGVIIGKPEWLVDLDL